MTLSGQIRVPSPAKVSDSGSDMAFGMAGVHPTDAEEWWKQCDSRRGESGHLDLDFICLCSSSAACLCGTLVIC